MRRLRVVLPVVAAVLSLAATASAQQDKGMGGFGEKGNVIISADRLMTLFSYVSRNEDFADTNNNVTVTRTVTTSGPAMSLLLGGNIPRENVHTIPRIALDYTIIPQLTIGGSIAVAFGLGGKQETKAGNVATSVDAPNTTIFGFAPRVGYIIDFNDTIAFWPRAGFAFYSASASSSSTDRNGTVTVTNTTSFFSLDLDPQFAFLPFHHVGFLAGPLVNIPLAGKVTRSTEAGGTKTDVSTDSKTFQFGITTSMLVWF